MQAAPGDIRVRRVAEARATANFTGDVRFEEIQGGRRTDNARRANRARSGAPRNMKAAGGTTPRSHHRATI
eukprot:scaffold5688_cov116-Isochrysis_galbana.AAC.11